MIQWSVFECKSSSQSGLFIHMNFCFIIWKYKTSSNDSQESLIWINYYMNICLVVTLVTECYIVTNFFEFIEEKYDFVKISCTLERGRKCLVLQWKQNHVTVKICIHLTNYHMYQEDTLMKEYNLPENDRKMIFCKKIQFYWFLMRASARTGVMMWNVNSFIIVE